VRYGCFYAPFLFQKFSKLEEELKNTEKTKGYDLLFWGMYIAYKSQRFIGEK
jgi:hypothetical protein